ncbi:MAG: exodeoxyribonuclease VII small subunit [Pseudomonadota bacterium]|nr:exodeoxyribonuclease VII small subunit [Pseudomonadota bacterium]
MTADVTALSFEAALAELEKIVKLLESGAGSLDDAVGLYERGDALRKHCEKRLNEARMRIERLDRGEDGSITAQPVRMD